MNSLTILVGKKADDLEKRAAADLAEDLKSVTGLEVIVGVESGVPETHSIFVGCPESSVLIAELNRDGKLGLGKLTGESEGGSIDTIQTADDCTVLVIAGIDPAGTLYTVYDFCTRELGVDPCAFWTGYTPELNADLDLFAVESRVLPTPVIPIRCYFDNDNDELANMTEPYLEIDFSYWKQIIDTLVRLKYNAIDLHDHLGRVEYTTREPYLKLVPGYEVNAGLVDQVIDYAKSRGMLIQVSFFLGWSFRTISDEAAHNWKDNKEEWLATWEYYLKETPIGRSDIFLNRPRDQKLDHPFKSSNGETAVEVFNEAFPLMTKLIRNHNPDAVIIADLYSEGRQAYRNGFRPQPPEDYILCWPDSGFGVFAGSPEDLSPYRSGIYMHAGFWRNHVVADPYVDLLEKSMKEAMYEYGMTGYCLVNGQTFRHFLLNIEACADICWYGKDFSSDRFLSAWIHRYFSSRHAGEVKELLELLHQGQSGEHGYVMVLSHISRWQSVPLPLRRFTRRRKTLLKETEGRLVTLQRGLDLADRISADIEDRASFFHDHFHVPFMLLYQINNILYRMLLVPEAKEVVKAVDAVNTLIEEHTAFRMNGDENPDWSGWYNPGTARPNGGYPKIENHIVRRKLWRK